ncbi:MAG: hypothetical protein CMF59_19320 [Leptospiraceae bacterium]|nr:hypothetical protein [Leptospiraceae bacterium]MBI41751.1 hypothetical protein [Leptospiraceae bacterium]
MLTTILSLATGVSQDMDQSIDQMRRIARWTGFFYLLIILCGMFAEGAVRAQIIVPENGSETAANILAKQGLFRSGILADLVMIVCDVIVALGFFVLLKSVSSSLSLLATFFRLTQASILGLNLIFLWMALQTLTGNGLSLRFQVEGFSLAHLLMNAHATGYKFALVFFACSLIVQAYLFYRSDLFPSWLAALPLIAALGYLIDTFATIALSSYSANAGIFEIIVVVSALVGEIPLCLWLLIKGVRSPN